MELSLKARVCRTLGWKEFPAEPKEWQREHAFLKVNDLKLLAKWSGFEIQLTSPAYDRAWQEVGEWNPELRYRLAGTNTRVEATVILRSTRVLADLLNPR